MGLYHITFLILFYCLKLKVARTVIEVKVETTIVDCKKTFASYNVGRNKDPLLENSFVKIKQQQQQNSKTWT